MKRIVSYLGAAFAVLLLCINAVPVSADSAGLSITPRKNYTISPGQTVTDKLTVGNLNTSTDLNLTLKMIDFTFFDQSGTPKLMLADNAPTTTWSLKPFTTLPKTVTVPKGSTKTVNFTITIPKTQGAGSYYSAIEYAAGGNGSGGQVGLNASGVSLVFVSVPGIVHENMTLQKFGAYQSPDNGVTGSYVFIATKSEPRQLAFTLKNSGNVAENPAGSIVLKNMLGHKVTTINNINSGNSLALLGQSRLFLTCIKTTEKTEQLEGQPAKTTACANPGLMPGRYTANLDVFYGQNGNQTKEVTGTASFWYLPVWFIAAVIIIILLLAYLIYRVYRKLTGKGSNGLKFAGKRR